MRKIDPTLTEKAARLDAWWARIDKVMNIIGWVAIIFTPIWWLIKAL